MKDKKQQYNQAVHRYNNLLNELEQLRKGDDDKEEEDLLFTAQFLSPDELKTHKRLCNRILKRLSLELENLQLEDEDQLNDSNDKKMNLIRRRINRLQYKKSKLKDSAVNDNKLEYIPETTT